MLQKFIAISFFLVSIQLELFLMQKPLYRENCNSTRYIIVHNL